MSLSLARLDLTQIFCDVDDFYREFEQHCEQDMARATGPLRTFTRAKFCRTGERPFLTG